MDQLSRFKAAVVTAYMAQAEDRFSHSKNPIHLWQMYALARQTGWPIPEHVLTYLDTVAKSLTMPIRRSP